MKKLLICLIAFSSYGKVLNYETTRLKSTAGAGVASLLMNEATVSNPAPLAFFNMSAIYFEKFSSEHTGINNSYENDNMAFIASDSSKNLKGSISYIKTRSGTNSQKQLNVAFASPIGPKSSAGIAYKKIEKSYLYNDSVVNESYKQFVPGVYHAINKNFMMGLIAIDPLRKNPKESKVVLGTQYTFLNYITLMLDTGADYKKELSTTSMVRSAAQVRVFDDFYLRFGAFEDKALKESGSGFGAGWIQPRLVIDFAVKNTEVKEDIALKQDSEDIKESSFSLSYRF